MKRKKKLKSVNTIPWQAVAVLNLIFIVWSVLCIVPFLLVLGVSFSSESSLNLQGYRVIPKELSFAAYDYVFSKSGMLLRAYGITIGGHFIRHDSLFNCYSDVCISAVQKIF